MGGESESAIFLQVRLVKVQVWIYWRQGVWLCEVVRLIYSVYHALSARLGTIHKARPGKCLSFRSSCLESISEHFEFVVYKASSMLYLEENKILSHAV